MKNKSKLTMKALQAQLNELKVNKGKVQEVNQPMRSSFAYMYVLSWILFLANKLPFLAKIAGLLRLYYGRTSFWRMIIIARKLFIVLNAIIGVYAVLKLTGMQYGSFMANFVGIGTSYIDIFTNLIKRLFNWFFDLFDYKVIPNNNSGTPKWWEMGPQWYRWYTNPMTNNGIMDIANNKDIRDLLPSSMNTRITPEISWYRDILWYGGLILGLAGFFGIAYLGYNYYQEVYNFVDRQEPPRDPNIFNAPDSPNAQVNLPDIEPRPGIGETIVSTLSSVKDKATRVLNPFNWFGSERVVDGNRRAFTHIQNDINNYDNRFYPFTTVDPFKPWYSRFRIGMFGESNLETLQRMRDRDFALREAIALAVKPIHSTGFITPGLGNVGLGLRFDSVSGATDWIAAGSSHQRTLGLMQSLPMTPRHIPEIVIDVLDDSVDEWASQPKIPMTEFGDPRLDNNLLKPELDVFS